MKEFLDSLGSPSGELRFVVGFILLPLLYFRDCVDVHKHMAATFTEMSKSVHPRDLYLIGKLRKSMYIFELDFWLVLAITVVLICTFCIGYLANNSRLLKSTVHQSTSATDVTAAAPPIQAVTPSLREKEKKVRYGRQFLNANGFSLSIEVSAPYSRPIQASIPSVSDVEKKVRYVRQFLNVYGFILAVIAVFHIRWKRTELYTILQRESTRRFEEKAKRPQSQITPSHNADMKKGI